MRKKEGSRETKLDEAKERNEGQTQRQEGYLTLIFQQFIVRHREFSAICLKTQIQNDIEYSHLDGIEMSGTKRISEQPGQAKENKGCQ